MFRRWSSCEWAVINSGVRVCFQNFDELWPRSVDILVYFDRDAANAASVLRARRFIFFFFFGKEYNKSRIHAACVFELLSESRVQLLVVISGYLINCLRLRVVVAGSVYTVIQYLLTPPPYTCRPRRKQPYEQ